MHGREPQWPKTAIAELVYGTGSINANDGEVAGFLQETPYGSVWAHFIAEAEDSGYLHLHGWNGQRCKHSWETKWLFMVCTVLCSNSS